MGGATSDARCPEIRALISQELDQELPETGQAAVRAHLRVCRDCARFAGAAAAATDLLRAAALEQPPPLVATEPVPVRRRSRAAMLALGAAAAASIAASAGLGAFLGRVTQSPPASGVGDHVSVAATQEPYLELHLLAMLDRSHPPTGRVIAT
jgi:predicted anti-sigma-YlaC factor YlaD